MADRHGQSNLVVCSANLDSELINGVIDAKVRHRSLFFVAQTPLEFAMATRAQLEPFSRGTGGVDLLAVTLAYQRACYGVQESVDEDYLLVERYYRAFFKNARDYVGGPKWLLTFWRV